MRNQHYVKPYILRYIETREGEERPAFFYSHDVDMNVVNTTKGQLLFIEACASASEVMTKTYEQRESDDTAQHALELETKTAKSREQDDDLGWCELELTTKTRVIRERDDD